MFYSLNIFHVHHCIILMLCTLVYYDIITYLCLQEEVSLSRIYFVGLWPFLEMLMFSYKFYSLIIRQYMFVTVCAQYIDKRTWQTVEVRLVKCTLSFGYCIKRNYESTERFEFVLNTVQDKLLSTQDYL